MTLSIAPLIYIMIFVAVVVLVEGIYLTVFGKSISLNSKISRRLTLLEKSGNREKVLEQLRKEMNQHMKSRGIPLYSILALIAIGMGIGGVYFWVNKKAKDRMNLLEEQLPDAVELMVRSLRVGHPFSSAIAIVAKEVPDPLGTEFGVIADEASYGRDIAESLKAFAERMDSQDLRFLAVAVSIQQTSGGNLAEILEGLAKVIRARFKLFRRVRAITAEAKWSGMFLSAFPIVALLMINVIKPDYYDEVKTTAVFIPTALLVCLFLIVNVIFMKIMVNIKV